MAPPFFNQLRDFCDSFERDVANLKKRFERPPGSYPEHYDKGMKKLKSQIEALKETRNITRGKIAKVQQFGYFVLSTRELIEEQMKDIILMENYLKKYGYKVPEEHLQQSIEVQKLLFQENEEETPLKVIGSHDQSGEDEGDAVDAQISNCENKVKDDDVEEHCTTPVQKKTLPWYLTPTPKVSSSMLKVEQWINTVRIESGVEAPLSSSSSSSPRKTTSSSSSSSFPKDAFDCASPNLNSYLSRNEPCIKRETPDEPSLSSYTIGTLKKQERATPDEPIMSTFTTAALQVGPSTTPEDPILSTSFHCGSNPSAVAVKYQDHFSKSVTSATLKSPKSPQLSDITKKILNIRNLTFPSEEPDSSKSFRDCNEEADCQNLQSPLLSELTRNLLISREGMSTASNFF